MTRRALADHARRILHPRRHPRRPRRDRLIDRALAELRRRRHPHA